VSGTTQMQFEESNITIVHIVLDDTIFDNHSFTCTSQY